MSTVGTLYDEVIKNGFAKLLMSQTFSGVTAVDFTIPTTNTALVFSFDNVYFSNIASGILRALLSQNNGASFLASYYWAGITCYANYDRQYHSSADISGAYLPLTMNDTQGHMLSGTLKMFICPSIQPLFWQMETWGTNPFGNWFHGFYPSGGIHNNLIRFYATVGTIQGRINMYSMKTGD